MRLVQQYAPASSVALHLATQGRGEAVNVVQVGDHQVHPGQQVQGQLVGADVELPGQGLNIRLAQGGYPDSGGQRLRQAVVIAPGVAAVIAVTGLARRKADALPGGEAQGEQAQARTPENRQGFLGGAPAHGFGGHIGDPVVLAGCQRLESRVQHRRGLADTGGRLQQQFAPLVYAFVHQLGDLALAATKLAVGEGQRLQAQVPLTAQPGQRSQPPGYQGQ